MKDASAKDSIWKWIVGIMAIINLALIIYIVTISFLSARTATPLGAEASDPSSEVILLRAQIQAIQQYHSDVLTTLWGSIASIATVIAVVAFAGMVQSARVYERDKKSMEQELRSDVERMERSTKEFLDTTITSGLAQFRTDIDSRLSSAQDNLETEFSQEVEELKWETLELRLTLTTAEANIAELRNIKSTALSHQIERLGLAIQTSGRYGLDYSIGYALDAVQRLLKEDNAPILAADDTARLLEHLKNTPDRFQVTIDDIKEMLKRGKT